MSGAAGPAPAATAESSPEAQPAPVEKNGDILILYTSDVHSGIDQGYDLILADNGDSMPETLTGSMPKHFMNEGKELAYGFCRGTAARRCAPRSVTRWTPPAQRGPNM